MLAHNASIYPNDVSLVELSSGHSSRKVITWAEFDASANRLANELLSLGIGKDDKVIHLMRNSINWLIAYFGIIRTGAWAVPLNYRFNSQDIKYCADIAKAKAFVLGDEFVDRVEAIRPALDSIEHYIYSGNHLPQNMLDFKEIISQASPRPVSTELPDTSGCGLYFTSGTTGVPKPILLTHKNMENSAIVEQKHHYQTHDDNFILIPPLYHTGAKMHWFGSLLVGGKATILTEVSPKIIFDAVHNERGSIVWLLVPWVQDILGALDRGELNKEDYDLSHWRLMHIGAQPVPPSLIKRWKEYFPDMCFDNNYGLSETSGPGCVHQGIENERKIGAIGKAGYGWQTRIVKDGNRDVAPGEIGELLVKGNGVMKEYYNNPELTAETIQDGWLHTGDMVREDEEGFIYIVDRKKDLIICGGENIFPVEIEAILQQHPKVHDVAVIGLPDARLGEVVTAVIQAKPGEKPSETEISGFCEFSLPRYKVPKRIIFDKVPRNPTGKIEKMELRRKYSG
jgi:acyl-CoA synthetase (AMP-forming)/AMP-acid ligase II